MKTYSAKPGEIAREWYVVDADGKTLGRLRPRSRTRCGQEQAGLHAARRHRRLRDRRQRGEDRRHRQKLHQKLHRHSGYPGGLRSRTLREQLERRPTEVLRKAVKGMLPRNRLARQQITKLKIYAGPTHPHEAQAPKTLEVS